MNLEQAFEKLQSMNLGTVEEVKLIRILGDLARQEFAAGCEMTRNQLLKINQN